MKYYLFLLEKLENGDLIVYFPKYFYVLTFYFHLLNDF